MKKPLLPLLILMAVLYFSACKDKKPEPPADEKGTVYLHIHTDLDTQDVYSYSQVFSLPGGRKISLSTAQIYLSHISFEKEDGTTISFPDTIVLKTLNKEPYLMGNIPTGKYTKVHFYAGLDATAAQKSPSSNYALSDPTMWFGSTAQPEGYVFVNFQGKIDTTAAANGNESGMAPFSYKLGTSAAYVEADLPEHAFSISANQTVYVHTLVNYAHLLDGIDLSKPENLEVNSPADNSSEAAKKLISNISTMFNFEDE